MNPLSAKGIDASKPGPVESFFSFIPIVGWTVAWFLEQLRFNPIYYDLRRQLLARHDAADEWSFLGSQQDSAKRIRRILAENFGWPNDYFIPEDPLRVVFWDRTGTGEAISAIADIEEDFDVSIPEQALLDLEHATIRDFVAFILGLTRIHSEIRAT